MNLEHFPVIVDINVAWGEMDALGHVNNVIYFRYLETARIEYFRQIGLLDHFDLAKVGPVLRDTQCQYRRPVVFPDLLQVGAKIVELHANYFMMEYAIFSKQQQTVTTKGAARVVMFDFIQQEKFIIPETLCNNIRQLEENDNL